MKLRQLFALTTLLFLTTAVCLAASPDEQRMTYIRQAYLNRLNLMADSPYDDGEPFNQITVTRDEMMPGAGMAHWKSTYYYYPPDYGMEEEQGGGLYFVQEEASDVSGLRQYYREFLFDVETQEPLFALLTIKTGDNEPATYRFYNMGNGRVDAVPSSDEWPEDFDGVYNRGPFLDQPDHILQQFDSRMAIFKAVRAQ